MDKQLEILLLEDSAEDAELIDIELQKTIDSFNLKTVATEKDFLSALDSFSPDLILSDYTLSAYDGLSALLHVRETISQDIPFIFVSGTIGAKKAIETMRRGATDYVFKENLLKLGPAVKRAIQEGDEKKQHLLAEKKLKKSTAYLTAAFDAIDDAICLLSAQKKILRFNKAMASFLNKPFDEIIGSFCYELVHNTKEPIPDCPVSRMLKTRQRETIFLPYEEKEIRVIVHPILDEKGDVFQIVHIISDITARKQAEEALLVSEEKYRAMMEAIDDCVYICSSDFLLEYMNPAMIKRTGQDGTGKKCFTILHDLNEPCPWCQFHMIEQGKSIHKDIVSTKDNRSYHVSSSPIFHEDGSVSKISVYRDITHIKKIENQLNQAHKMESIGDLAGGIAHDFNNILSAIIGYTELTFDEVEKESIAAENLQEIYSAGKRAKDLVKHILTFARQSDEEIKPIQPNLIAKEVLKFIRSSIPATIEIKQKIDSNSLIMGSATQIHQMFMNLCTNAAYSMEDRGGVLEIQMKDISIDRTINWKRLGLKPGPYIEIVVSDSGSGIEPEIIAKIFEPYFTTKAPGEGTGMGLSLVHGIIESYGGKITVDSAPEKGTTFTIFLPITKKRGEHGLYEPEALPSGVESILLVDDEMSITKMGSRILGQLGYSVTTKTSSVEALELFRSKPKDFDLVITDLTMPHLTGEKLAVELMKIRADIPIILCTGYSKKISKGSFPEIGIKAFAYKPIVKADLAKIVRKVLDETKIIDLV